MTVFVPRKSAITHQPALPELRTKVEDAYKGEYVMTSHLANDHGHWSTQMYDIYYQKGASATHPSDYFGITARDRHAVIASAVSLENIVIWGAMSELTGEIVYSRHRHDYVQINSGAAVDGGRAMPRTIGGRPMGLVLEEGKLIPVKDDAFFHDIKHGFCEEMNDIATIRGHAQVHALSLEAAYNHPDFPYQTLNFHNEMAAMHRWLREKAPEDYLWINDRILFTDVALAVEFKLVWGEHKIDDES